MQLYWPVPPETLDYELHGTAVIFILRVHLLLLHSPVDQVSLDEFLFLASKR